MIHTGTPKQLWFDFVTESEKETGLHLTEESEYYLIQTLIVYTNPEARINDGALCIPVLQELVKARDAARWHIIRNCGDQCLLISGLFPEQCEKRRVSPNYYTQLGEMAYKALSQRGGQKFFEAITEELPAMVDILQNMSSNRHARKEVSEALENIKTQHPKPTQNHKIRFH